MGTYLNPGNKGFKRIVNGEYVDKTGLISLINSAIGTTKNLIYLYQQAPPFREILRGADAVCLL